MLTWRPRVGVIYVGQGLRLLPSHLQREGQVVPWPEPGVKGEMGHGGVTPRRTGMEGTQGQLQQQSGSEVPSAARCRVNLLFMGSAVELSSER